MSKFLANPQGKMFGDENDPFSVENEANHKAFLDAFLNQINNKKSRSELNETLKTIILQILEKKQ